MTDEVYEHFVDVVEADFTYLIESSTIGGLIDCSIEIKCKRHTHIELFEPEMR
jgi:hypothetical protein